MRIGIYLENYIAGGVDSVIVNKINSWPIEDDEFIIYCNEDHEGLEKVLIPRINRECEIVKTKILSHHDIYNLFQSSPPLIIRAITTYIRHLFSLINYVKLVRIFKKKPVDALFIHNGGFPGALSSNVAVASAKVNGIDKIFTIIHNLPKHYTLREYIFDYIYDHLLNMSNKIICVSSQSANLLEERRSIRTFIEVINNGITGLSIENHTEISSKSQSGLNIIMVGSFEERKGHQKLIQAIDYVVHSEKLENIQLHIVGSGSEDEKRKIQDKIKTYNLKDKFTFHGFVGSIGSVMNDMDMLVFPSIENESMPMVILEAMSMGLPIIATDVGGIKEMIGKTGIIIEPGNYQMLANEIINLSKNPSLRKSLGRSARKRFKEEFTAQSMAESYYSLL